MTEKRLTLSSLDKRVEALEGAVKDIHEISVTSKKVLGLIKVWAPIIATAAVTSGLVNGKVGAFLAALIGIA
jgi:hypothetical protein